MSYELLYTSAPKGLKPLSRGFCTVLCSEDMPRDLMDRLEALSGYRPVFPPEHEKNHLNPIAFSHVVLDLQGQEYSVVSRIADFGIDYTNRNNKLADHRAVLPSERPAGGPTWLLQRPNLMRTQWSDSPTRTPAGLKVPQGDRAIRICEETKLLTGDAGWAGVLAEAFLQNPKRAVSLTFEAGIDPLPMISEALSLIPIEKRWEVTFSTYYGNLPSNVQCLWRCVLKDSPEWQASQRSSDGLKIDLCSPLPQAVGGPLVTAAREGVLPAVSSPSMKKTDTAPPILKTTKVIPPETSPAVDFNDFEAFEEHEKFIEHRVSREKVREPRESSVSSSAVTPALPPMPPPRPRTVAAKPKGNLQSVVIGAGSGLVVLLVGIGAFVMFNQEALEQTPSVAGTQQPAVSIEGGALNDSLRGAEEPIGLTEETEEWIGPSDHEGRPDSTGRFNPPPFVDRPNSDPQRRMENKNDVPVPIETKPDDAEEKEEKPESSTPIHSRLANGKLEINRVQLTPINKSNSSIANLNGSNAERTKLPAGEKISSAVRLFIHPPVESSENIQSEDSDGELLVTVEQDSYNQLKKNAVARVHWDSATQELVWIWEKNAKSNQKALVKWSVVELATSEKSFLFAKPSPLKTRKNSEFKSQWNSSGDTAEFSGDFPRLHAGGIKLDFGVEGLESLQFDPVDNESAKENGKESVTPVKEGAKSLQFQSHDLEKFFKSKKTDEVYQSITKFPLLQVDSQIDDEGVLTTRLISFKESLNTWKGWINSSWFGKLKELDVVELRYEDHEKQKKIFNRCRLQTESAFDEWVARTSATIGKEKNDEKKEKLRVEREKNKEKIQEIITVYLKEVDDFTKVRQAFNDGVPFQSIRLYYEVKGEDGTIREVEVVNVKKKS